MRVMIIFVLLKNRVSLQLKDLSSDEQFVNVGVLVFDRRATPAPAPNAAAPPVFCGSRTTARALPPFAILIATNINYLNTIDKA